MPPQHVFVGSFVLGDKENGRQLTAEDEEVLVLFAAHAAVSVANAGTFRAERRTRADLESPIEISPVGMVIFDGRTGDLLSIDREAMRIVNGLRTVGRSVPELLGVVDLPAFRGAGVLAGRDPALADLQLCADRRTGCPSIQINVAKRQTGHAAPVPGPESAASRRAHSFGP